MPPMMFATAITAATFSQVPYASFRSFPISLQPSLSTQPSVRVASVPCGNMPWSSSRTHWTCAKGCVKAEVLVLKADLRSSLTISRGFQSNSVSPKVTEGSKGQRQTKKVENTDVSCCEEMTSVHPSDVTINSCISAFAGQWLQALRLLAGGPGGPGGPGGRTLQMLVIRYEGTILAAMRLGSATGLNEG